MAATGGGGKIRTRRYHIASKPYAKGKQQPGLISRVTDTVKSIVPSWLQKYFKNGEIDEGRETRVEVEQNNVPPSNGSDEAAPLRDGRNSPEPSTSNAEPSTSKASLNFHDVLSRPPLNRAHLHFPSHDASPALGGSSSLFSQPSTSAAPFAGSPFAVASSFSLVKEIKDSSSQHEDDNISTTSGFSSRASDKDVPNTKTAPLLWSPEMERTHSGSQPTHATLKKPAFNLSVFGTSSTSAMNSSVLNSSQLGDSPFYPGKTTYGGAAAARTARGRPGTPYQHPVRRQIKAKPAGAQPCGVTSATARRILQSLERMSSPLADAKRIPSLSSPLSTPLNHSSEDLSHMQAKKKKLDPAVPPVQKLLIPAAASVSGNRSMSFRPSLTPGSVSRTVEKSKKETPVRCFPQIPSPKVPDATPAPTASSTSSLSYPLSSTPAANSSGGGGKMKRERNGRISSKRQNDEDVEVPDLPAISLPITTLPQLTFSLSSPLPVSTAAPSTNSVTFTPAEPAMRKEEPTVSAPFTFSLPIFKSSTVTTQAVPASTGFTFSAPALMTSHSASKKRPAPAERQLKEASEGQGEFEGPFKPAKTLKQGSVLDILKGPGFSSPAQSSPAPEKNLQMASTGLSSTSTSVSGFGEKFKPAAGSWNCDACLLQNKASDKVCVACSAPQPNSDSSSKSKPAKAPAASLASLFAPPAGNWDCDTCLVRNKPEAVKCVACDTAKPGTGVKPAITLTPVTETPSILCTAAASATTTTSTSNTSTLLGFGDKFKKPEGAWNCDVCMVQNKAQDLKCLACQSPKPGGAATAPSSLPPLSTPASSAPLLGFGDKFKKPEGSWECDTCFVSNKAEAVQCVACQTAKPGAKAESKGNLSSTTASNSFGFKFGTNSSNSASDGLKFGGSSFQFKDASSDSTSDSRRFKFGTANVNSSVIGFGCSSLESCTDTSSSERFKFGTASSASASEVKKSESQNPSTAFKFGFSSGIGSGAGDGSTTTTTASAGFTFGVSKPEEKEGSVSTFSLSTAKTEKTDAPSPSASTTTPAAPIPVHVFGKPPVSEPAPPASSAPALAEEPAKKPAPTISTFTFGKSEEKANTTLPSVGFVFTAGKQDDKPAPSLSFTFNQSELPKDVLKPTLTLGKPAEPAETPKPVFTFGQNAENTAPKLSFGFVADSSSAAATTTATTTTPAPSLFGASSSSTLAPTTAASGTFSFGQNASSNAPAAKTFVFGQQQDGQSASTAPPAATPAANQPFSFGSASNSTTPNFSFGGAATATPASAAPAPSATNSPFVFNSASSSSGFGSGSGPAPVFGQGSSQAAAPMFGSPAPTFSVTASQAPAFGAKPSAAPVFGQQSGSTPFGSSAPPAGQGGFQFGGTSGFGSSAGNTGVFTFGAGPGATASPAAPPTMPGQPAGPGGSFNFTQSPSFNIGSSNSSFSPATSGQHAITGRKIKTAVRRRK